MEKIEKSLKRILPRRSPRLLHKKITSTESLNIFPSSASSASSSSVNSILTTSASVSNILDINQLNLKSKPPIVRGLRSNSKRKMNAMESQERSLKRLRESTVSLRSMENIMPAKRLKSEDDIKYQVKPIDVHRDSQRKKFTSKVASFAKGLSPRKNPSRKISGVTSDIQRASSLRASKTSSVSHHSTTLTRSASVRHHGPSPVRKRNSKLWVESLSSEDTNLEEWTPQQIKRQEAIYELYCGEKDLVEDLKLLQEAYKRPIEKLKILEEEDLSCIFGHIDTLLPLHEELVKNLENVQDSSGCFNNVGQVLTDWIPKLRPYIPYCANQLKIKEIVSQKEKDCKSLSDFLQRCLESPFSRKLDLWAFLDAPRSKLVKYPLLIASIHKYTPKDEADRSILYRNKKQFESILREADIETGYSKCAFYKARLYFMDENENTIEAIENARSLLCHGSLKNKTGNKIDAFLFDTIFLCGRQATRNGTPCYQVSSQPILTSDLEVSDLSDGEIRLGGSFRSTLSKTPIAKHIFRVSSRDPLHGKAVVLQANNEHDKKQWLNSFHKLHHHETNGIEETTEHDDLMNGNT